MSTPQSFTTFISLQPGSIHCIKDACGARIRVQQGLVWLTEEGELEDVFLGEGDAYQIRGSGRILIEVETTTRGRHVATLEIVDMPDRSKQQQQEQPQGQSVAGGASTTPCTSNWK